jgi:hypothetical protein
MFRRKRGDTSVGAIEKKYRVDLNARSDMKLDTLLNRRGFDSQSQLLRAYSCSLDAHARTRHLFLSFHYEDRQQVNGFRLMGKNKNIDISFYDGSVREEVDSTRSAYVKSQIAAKIQRCSVLVCLIGDGTAWRKWVEWEISKALELGKGVCGVQLKGSRGRAPDILRKIGAPIASWNIDEIISAIECAAARRS